jgi:hypothetical protein
MEHLFRILARTYLIIGIYLVCSIFLRILVYFLPIFKINISEKIIKYFIPKITWSIIGIVLIIILNSITEVEYSKLIELKLPIVEKSLLVGEWNYDKCWLSLRQDGNASYTGYIPGTNIRVENLFCAWTIEVDSEEKESFVAMKARNGDIAFKFRIIRFDGKYRIQYHAEKTEYGNYLYGNHCGLGKISG